MKIKITVLISVVILAAIAFLTTFYNPIDTNVQTDWPEMGRYKLKVKGDKEILLQGRVIYESLTAVNNKQDQQTTWRLVLRNEHNLLDHSFDFYIADHSNNHVVQNGK